MFDMLKFKKAFVFLIFYKCIELFKLKYIIINLLIYDNYNIYVCIMHL